MAENTGKKPVGAAGRGSLLSDMMKQQKPLEMPSTSSSRSLDEPSSFFLPQSVIDTITQTDAEIIPPSTADERSRTLGSSVLSTTQSVNPQTASYVHLSQNKAMLVTTIKEQADTTTGVTGNLSELSIYDTESVPVSTPVKLLPRHYTGTSGSDILVATNYIDLNILEGKGFFQYEVKFDPDIDSRSLRKKLLNHHTEGFGHTKVFDGVLLCLPFKLSDDKLTYESLHPSDGSTVTLTLIFKKLLSMKDNIQFFNILFGRIMKTLALVRIGRQNFDPKSAYAIPQHQLEVWPGYVTAVNEYKGGLKLCIDAKHRVLQTQTIRDIIVKYSKSTKSTNEFKALVSSKVIGVCALTRYNNKTYRIDDIAWDKNPTFVFDRQNTKTSLIEYYKHHWNVAINDYTQPLLVHRAKERLSSGETQDKMILLVPELCYITGLTDDIRSDFRIMKDLDAITKVSPGGRQSIIQRFLNEVQNNDVTKNMLLEWGLKIENDIARFPGRLLNSESIYFGKDERITARPNADWGSEMSRKSVLRTPNLTNWLIVYCRRDRRNTLEFIDMLRKVARMMGMTINLPREIILQDDRIDNYLREIRKNMRDDVQFVVIVFSSNRNDRYGAVKKLCCVEVPIPSQVIIGRTISRADKLRSITQKIALQINCKLGGALWALNIPFDKCMICGIDVYHAGSDQRKRGSVAGFVASMDKLLTTWYNKVCIQGPNQELIDLLQICLTSAINMYNKKNGFNPDRIIIYRDGVGDGQLEIVAKYEIKQILTTFARIDPRYTPRVSVIIVQKRINTRLFLQDRGLKNPLPGTIVDSYITRRSLYDFFLVSQNITHGTVTPTHYIVIYDDTGMKPDHMQRLTYKLCHLYFNWPGTIRVPAPCQYAHKLVYLVGQSVQIEPHQCLSNNLYYL